LLNTKPEQRKEITFKQLYDKWLPTHRAGKSTINCYKAAFRYFEPLYGIKIADIDVDDLQECVDDCDKGKQTKRNMKAVCGLVYKYGIPRKAIPDNLNLASFLIVDGETSERRVSFTDVEIEKIKNACGKIPHAEEIYCMIYTGFRPSEFLALKASDYDPSRKTLIGGSKTAAGKNRVVTLSPKIAPIIAAKSASGGPLFADPSGKAWSIKDFRENAFYPALETIGIENPVENKRHRITPHSCRHTFATLMKRVDGADKDKLELIGHASGEMLRYYQDVDIEDLRRITDAI
jgi:integrase